jgi:hypothetical protein
MSKDVRGSFEITKDAFGSIEALVKDARGNAIFAGNGPKRIRIGAQYARLAGMASVALADLLVAVADGNRKAGDRAKMRLAQIDRDIQKHLDMVAVDNERWAKESGAVRMQISGEDFQKLMRGEQPPELIAKIEAAREEQESS